MPSGAVGRLSYRPGDTEGPVARTIRFIVTELPAWRDDPRRPAAWNEKHTNSSLCDFLDSRSRSALPMVRFKHEAVESKNRTVDLAAHGIDEMTIIGQRGYTIYEPFLVIEAKRLPAPTKDREREYVTSAEKAMGGIQRFRLGFHGSNVETAVIVGYVEQDSLDQWFDTINAWIADLAKSATFGGCTWTSADRLLNLRLTTHGLVATSDSAHERSTNCCTSSIKLKHIWLLMK